MAPTTKPKPIPDGYRRITPALVVRGGVKALEFYAEVFEATERMRFPGPDGTIAHAEIEIGTRSSSSSMNPRRCWGPTSEDTGPVTAGAGASSWRDIQQDGNVGHLHIRHPSERRAIARGAGRLIPIPRRRGT